MTRFWWVRHGPTHQKTFTGWRDVPADLSDTARIARLAAYLPRDALVVSSDLVRAHATADALQNGRTRLPDDPALREFDFGDWDGRHWSDVAETDPDLSRAYWETPGDIKPPNGESWNDAAARVGAVIDPLNGTARDIIVVAHMGVIMTQIQRASGCSAYAATGHKIDPLSVTTLVYSDENASVERINHQP